MEKNQAQKRDKESQSWGRPTLYSVIKKVLIDKVTFVQNLEGIKEGSHSSVGRDNTTT